MDAKTKKIIGLAAVGLILYELWKREQATAGPSIIQTNSMSEVPIWAQQLSETSGTTTDIIGDLMNIPQGPGGTAGDPAGTNFFNLADCLLPPA